MAKARRIQLNLANKGKGFFSAKRILAIMGTFGAMAAAPSVDITREEFTDINSGFVPGPSASHVVLSRAEADAVRGGGLNFEVAGYEVTIGELGSANEAHAQATGGTFTGFGGGPAIGVPVTDPGGAILVLPNPGTVVNTVTTLPAGPSGTLIGTINNVPGVTTVIGPDGLPIDVVGGPTGAVEQTVCPTDCTKPPEGPGPDTSGAEAAVITLAVITAAAQLEIDYHPATQTAPDWHGIFGTGEDDRRIDVTTRSIDGIDGLNGAPFSMDLFAESGQQGAIVVDARFGRPLAPRIINGVLGAGAVASVVGTGGSTAPWLIAGGGAIGFFADDTISHTAWWILGNAEQELEEVRVDPGARIQLHPGQFTRVVLPSGETGIAGITKRHRAQVPVAFFMADNPAGLDEFFVTARRGDRTVEIGADDNGPQGRFFQGNGRALITLGDRDGGDWGERLDFTMPFPIDVNVGDCNLCDVSTGIPLTVTRTNGQTVTLRANIEYRTSPTATDGAGDIVIVSYQATDAAGMVTGPVFTNPADLTNPTTGLFTPAEFRRVLRAVEARTQAFDGVQDNLAALTNDDLVRTGLFDATPGIDIDRTVTTGTQTDGIATLGDQTVTDIGGTVWNVSAFYGTGAAHVANGQPPLWIGLSREVDDSMTTVVFTRNAAGDYVTDDGTTLEEVLGGDCVEERIKSILAQGELAPPVAAAAVRSAQADEPLAPPVAAAAPVTMTTITMVPTGADNDYCKTFLITRSDGTEIYMRTDLAETGQVRITTSDTLAGSYTGDVGFGLYNVGLERGADRADIGALRRLGQALGFEGQAALDAARLAIGGGVGDADAANLGVREAYANDCPRDRACAADLDAAGDRADAAEAYQAKIDMVLGLADDDGKVGIIPSADGSYYLLGRADDQRVVRTFEAADLLRVDRSDHDGVVTLGEGEDAREIRFEAAPAATAEASAGQAGPFSGISMGFVLLGLAGLLAVCGLVTAATPAGRRMVTGFVDERLADLKAREPGLARPPRRGGGSGDAPLPPVG